MVCMAVDVGPLSEVGGSGAANKGPAGNDVPPGAVESIDDPALGFGPLGGGVGRGVATGVVAVEGNGLDQVLFGYDRLDELATDDGTFPPGGVPTAIRELLPGNAGD